MCFKRRNGWKESERSRFYHGEHHMSLGCIYSCDESTQKREGPSNITCRLECAWAGVRAPPMTGSSFMVRGDGPVAPLVTTEAVVAAATDAAGSPEKDRLGEKQNNHFTIPMMMRGQPLY